MDGTVNDKSEGMMSRTRLSEAWSKKLTEQPETGMGFQNVTVTLKGGKEINGIVINGSMLETLSPVKESDIEGLRVKGSW